MISRKSKLAGVAGRGPASLRRNQGDDGVPRRMHAGAARYRALRLAAAMLAAGAAWTAGVGFFAGWTGTAASAGWSWRAGWTWGISQAYAQEPGPSLWDEEQGSRYSNRKARHVGDLITVLVTESSTGSNRSSLKTKKQSKFNAEGGPGRGPLGFLPSFGAKTDIKDELDGTGQTLLQGQLSTKITAQVLEIRPNGHLVVEGSRLISVNGDEDRILLHGVVRPEDIAADNTVQSTFLAEAVISYNGKGPVHGSARRGIFQRIVSWFF